MFEPPSTGALASDVGRMLWDPMSQRRVWDLAK